MAGRRDLSFASLDELMPEVERLLEGHETVGTWSLGQICRHLAVALELTARSAGRAGRVEDTPDGPEARRQFFEAGTVPEGRPIPSARLEPPPGLDDRAEAEALGAALARFAATAGPFGAHPLLGPMTDEEWARFHAIHCAHHLSFARPAGAAPRKSEPWTLPPGTRLN